VEGVEMTRPAEQVEQHNRLHPLLGWRAGLRERPERAGRRLRQELPEQGERAGAQEFAARETVAGLARTTEEREHGVSPKELFHDKPARPRRPAQLRTAGAFRRS